MKPVDESIYILIAARLCGEPLAGAEERQLLDWIAASPANGERYDYYLSLLAARDRLRVLDRARPPAGFARRRFRRGGRVSRVARRWSRYAAVLLPVAILLVVTSREGREGRAPVERDIAPGASRAVLTTGDGQRFLLADQGMLIAGGVALPGVAPGTLEYRAAGGESDAPVETDVLEVGRGGEYRVDLPDGSRAWLNSESRLVYPSRFTGDTRRVALEGEGYFEVARDTAREFIVTAGACEIRVLGTAFNVKHHAGDRHVVTTLARGSVEVRAAGRGERLRPGQQCAYDPGGGTMTLRDVDAARVVSWTAGLFLFDDVPVEELARQIARWYDVEVRFADTAARAASFTGAMERYRPVSYIIRLLEETNTVRCTLENDRVLTIHASR